MIDKSGSRTQPGILGRYHAAEWLNILPYSANSDYPWRDPHSGVRGVRLLYRSGHSVYTAGLKSKKCAVTLPLFDVYAPGNRHFGGYGQVTGTFGEADYANERTSFAIHSFVFDPFRSDVHDHLDGSDGPMSDHSGADDSDDRLWDLPSMTDAPDCDHAMTENPLGEYRFPIYEGCRWLHSRLFRVMDVRSEARCSMDNLS